MENALAAGEATMIAAEIIEALKYVGDARPVRRDSPSWASFQTR